METLEEVNFVLLLLFFCSKQLLLIIELTKIKDVSIIEIYLLYISIYLFYILHVSLNENMNNDELFQRDSSSSRTLSRRFVPLEGEHLPS